MSSAPVDPLIGQTLDGRYIVRSKIARGGMAMVYLGDDLRLGRKVAIKIMHAHLADDENFTRRFEQEARSAAGLGHPNVVNVFDQGEAHGVPYLVMEYLPGITLRELLKQRRALTPEEAGEIAEAILSGLAAAHEAGIVHRDLKPENVLLADDGRIKIGDFGLARAVSANTTTGQALLGTIAYLSPELVTRGIADARSDLYAFGIVLFEMLTGKQPYTGEQPMQIAYQHAHSDVPQPSSVTPAVPAEYDQLVQWVTQRDADSRPNDAREALEYMRALRSGASMATTVLPQASLVSSVTPSTAVLSSADQQTLAGSNRDPKDPALSSSSLRGAATSRAHEQGVRRARRGRWIAALLTLLIAGSAGAGWWWGQGPGSSVVVPELAGLRLSEAEPILEDLDLIASPFECASLTTAAGLVDHSEPASGVRVERGSTVRICQSTGPQLLPVPPLIDLSLEEAQAAIETARFVFGEIVDERFDGDAKGTVILAMDADGNGLGETYPEQGVIDLIVSAGSAPEVAGLSVESASKSLSDAGLNLDTAMNGEAHHDSIEAGLAIRLLTNGEVLSVGDAVGLEISLGPELFEVPSIAAGTNVNQAAELMRSHGFSVDTGLIPEGPLGEQVEVKRTSPAAGEMVIAGTTIRFEYI